ncbi:MAG: tetratricopeptide repeat protein [Bacteroidota bacterium]|nr:tetratricopeptide repeat protein [Bacteroidota bacterium]
MQGNRFYNCLIFLFLSGFLFSQNSSVDSLKNILKSKTADSIKCRVFIELIESEEDPLIWSKYNEELHMLAVKNLATHKKGSKAYETFQFFYAAAQNNQGWLSNHKGDVTKALEYYHESLKIYDRLGAKNQVATLYNNIAHIWHSQAEYDKSIEYYNKSLKLYEDANDKKGVAFGLNNIAAVYKKKGELNKALEYCYKSLKMMEELKDKKGIATLYTNIGTLLVKNNEIDKGFDYLNKSLALKKELNDQEGYALSLNIIGNIYFTIGKTDKALEFGVQALKLNQQLGYPDHIRRSAELLKRVYEKQSNYKKALEMHELYVLMKDSVNNEETRKASIKNQLKYEYEKKAAADSVKAGEEKKIQDAKLAESNAKLKQERTQRIALYGGLTLVLIFSGFMFNRFKVTQKQKNIIEKQKVLVEEQKHIVDEKQKEILDSINYAKRLQEAILPPLSLWKKNLPDSFILYKPKDIVAGDFYWMHTIENENDSLIILAAADCTGHGVPGAMVSVVCSNALNRTVKEFGITDPGQILNKVRELVIETFEKSESEVKDGMDISLCSFKKVGNDFTELFWAGANNPLWIVRHSNEKETGIEQITPDKMPIGKYAEEKSFTTHKVEIKKGDCFYMFTDGYADQFGGPKGKKLKYKAMDELIVKNCSKKMEEQEKLLSNYFEEWKAWPIPGGRKQVLEQIDDVCVIGIRL